ncbi:MAG: FecR domain-containing protein [Myxococcota bacterium]|nr:FecR domain-containing protein [Myxococcota bacterium]
MRAALALALLLAACGDDGEVASVDPTPPPRRHAHDVDGHGEGHGDPAPARLLRTEGGVTIGGAATRGEMDVEPEQPIEVPEGGRAVLQLRDGGRVELDGGSLARVTDDGGAQLLLLQGALFAVQPPSGNAPRPPLRIASAATTIEIGGAGEVYLALFPSGAAWVSVLGGMAAISVGEADNRRRLRALELGGGHAVAVTGRLAEPTEGPGRLTAAREAARTLASGDPEPPARDRLTRDLSNEVDRLDQALRWLETETRRGRELTTTHREAVRQKNVDEGRRLQRELVEHSRALYRLRRLATARWERTRALHLRLVATGNAPAEDPIDERRDRVVGLLGP